MKSQISKGSKDCDDFVNWSRLRGEADSSDVRGRMQRRKDFKSSSKRNLIKYHEKCLLYESSLKIILWYEDVDLW